MKYKWLLFLLIIATMVYVNNIVADDTVIELSKEDMIALQGGTAGDGWGKYCNLDHLCEPSQPYWYLPVCQPGDPDDVCFMNKACDCHGWTICCFGF